jgi:hypothetical protein
VASQPRTKSGRRVTRSGSKPTAQARTQAPPTELAEPTQDAATATKEQPAALADQASHDAPGAPAKRIRLITNLPGQDAIQTMMGRQIRPFAKPAQSGTFSPFAVTQARRGH